MCFLRRLFGRTKKVDRRKTTKKFREFQVYQIAENERIGKKDSSNNLLAIYICKYKMSPWEDDKDLEEARKFLIEMGLTEKII